MGAGADHQRHQLVPGRMEFDFVDAVPAAVEGDQARAVGVGQARQVEHLRAAQVGAERIEPIKRPLRTLARQALAQRRVAAQQVHAAKGRRLVEDFVGVELVHRGSSRLCILAHNVADRHRIDGFCFLRCNESATMAASH
jgi:hypothetical protein